MSTYTASKSKTGNRPGWSVTFRHPIRNDTRGKPGRKIRRGLGTTDEAEADRLVAQMNAILSDETWWSSARREDAELHFAKSIVDAFYDELLAVSVNPWDVRGAHIPLPGREMSYTRVLFVGTTGAGKTSLLRHLIGSDPEEDRFPSTSTAKTTIADTEVVLADGPYRAVVTFASRFAVQANVEGCVFNACAAVWDGDNDDRIADRLLNHPDQRFRMSYILGGWLPLDADQVASDDWTFGNEGDTPAFDEGVAEGERAKDQAGLRAYVQRIKRIFQRCLARVSEGLEEDITKRVGRDRDEALDFVLWDLQDDNEIGELVHDIVDDMLARFDLIEAGELCRRGDSWPDVWLFETKQRNEFIREVRWFSSNYAPDFGRLLTPLVDGIRVSGPLYPAFAGTGPKLALLDGQGLGHTPDSASSVTTHVTRRFAEVDVILLVDNAQQPMQAAPLSVLRVVAASGNYDKLAIAFTHFDLVKGHNLPTPQSKRDHVMAAVRNVISSLKDSLGALAANALERALLPRCFMFGGLQIQTKKLPRGVIAEFEKLLVILADAIREPEPPVASPIYDTTGILFAVQIATRKFHDPWMGRLGLEVFPGVSKEHWTRVKALTRRIQGEWDVEYDSLKPLADLQERLMEEISKFLDAPAGWTRKPDSDDVAQQATSVVKKSVFGALHSFLHERLISSALKEWRDAYGRAGTGSTIVRARDIDEIYGDAAPVLGSVVSTEARDFLTGLRKIVHEAIEAAGGEVRISLTT
jgi:GTPase SAR1 family protein